MEIIIDEIMSRCYYQYPNKRPGRNNRPGWENSHILIKDMGGIIVLGGQILII